MTKSKILATAAVANILVLGAAMTTTALAVPEQPKSWEKCAGISKAGQNDCGSLAEGGHACAGKAEHDNLDTEWIYVPEGTCEKITGGMKGKVKPAK